MPCTLRPNAPPPSHIASCFAAILVAAGLASSGCGSGEIQIGAEKKPLYPVTGKLLLPDGKPLGEGTIRLIPVKPPGWTATGKIEPDGSFTLKTADQGEGAPEGEYKVSIESTLTVPGRKAGSKMPAVPPEYSDEDGSGLKVTVKPGPTDLGSIKLIPGGTATKGGGPNAARD